VCVRVSVHFNYKLKQKNEHNVGYVAAKRFKLFSVVNSEFCS